MLCKKCREMIPDNSLFCNLCGAEQSAEQKRTRKPKSRGNGQGSVYKLPNGKWRAIKELWRRIDDNGKIIRKTVSKSDFKTKKDAINHLPLLGLNTKRSIDMFVSQLYEEWASSIESTASKSTVDGYKNCYEKYCTSIANLRLSQIKTAELQQCIDNCDKSPRMKQLTKVTLSSMFKYAEQNDYVHKNYSAFVRVPKQIKPDKDAFSELEIAAIWKSYNSGNTFMRYALIMIYTGIRPAELRQITPDRINITDKTLTAGVKTESGIDRKIPLCAKVLPLFIDLEINFTRNTFYKAYKAAFEQSGIRYLPPHCCRHTAATALVLAKVEPKIIQDILGHSSFSVTADNYVHVPMDKKLEAVNKIK